MVYRQDRRTQDPSCTLKVIITLKVWISDNVAWHYHTKRPRPTEITKPGPRQSSACGLQRYVGLIVYSLRWKSPHARGRVVVPEFSKSPRLEEVALHSGGKQSTITWVYEQMDTNGLHGTGMVDSMYGLCLAHWGFSLKHSWKWSCRSCPPPGRFSSAKVSDIMWYPLLSLFALFWIELVGGLFFIPLMMTLIHDFSWGWAVVT